jgi:hypothetical protein
LRSSDRLTRERRFEEKNRALYSISTNKGTKRTARNVERVYVQNHWRTGRQRQLFLELKSNNGLVSKLLPRCHPILTPDWGFTMLR